MNGARSSMLDWARRVGSSPRAAAIAVLLVMLAVVYYAFHPALPFSHPYQLHGIFADANQLRTGSPVRIAGVNVGKVTAISEGPGQTSSVTFTVSNSGQPIHSDATLRVRPRLFLEGGFYIELSPGSPSASTLRSGSTVPLPQTSYPVQFDRVLTTFQFPTRNDLRTLTQELGSSLSDGGAAGLRATAVPLAPVLSDTAQISESVRGRAPNDLAGAISSSSRVTGALGDHAGQLVDLVASLNTTAAALAAQDAALGATIAGLDRTLAVAPPALDAIDRSLPLLASFSTALDPGLRSAPAALDDASAELDLLGALVAPPERARLLTALRAGLVQLPTLINRLGGLFPVAGPVTQCLITHVIPMLTSVVPDGALTTGRPAWQDFAHSLGGFASQAQNFDANGYSMRYLAGLGSATVSTGGLPGLGQLVGAGSPTRLQSRPLWLGPGSSPQFRPDQPCTSQPLPNLNVPAADAGLAPTGASAQAGPKLTWHSVLTALAPANLRKALIPVPARPAR